MTTPRANIPVYVATAGALAYTASKVHFAVLGELGVAGFHDTPEANAAFGDATAAQLGNVGVGVVAVVLTLLLLVRFRSRLLRWPLLVANWVAALMIGVGVSGFVLRALGVMSSPDWAATGWQAWVSLVVGGVWVVAWVVALVRVHRRRLI